MCISDWNSIRERIYGCITNDGIVKRGRFAEDQIRQRICGQQCFHVLFQGREGKKSSGCQGCCAEANLKKVGAIDGDSVGNSRDVARISGDLARGTFFIVEGVFKDWRCILG